MDPLYLCGREFIELCSVFRPPVIFSHRVISIWPVVRHPASAVHGDASCTSVQQCVIPRLLFMVMLRVRRCNFAECDRSSQ